MIAQALRRVATDRAAALVFALAAIASFSLLLFLGRDLTFWHDEWGFISERQECTPDAFLQPHNEHWITTTVVIYKLLLEPLG